MAPNDDPAFARYLAERDAILANEDIEAMRAHLVKYGSAGAKTADVETLRAAWHKARTGVLTLPVAERRRSVAWLEERGMTHLAQDLGPAPVGNA